MRRFILSVIISTIGICLAEPVESMLGAHNISKLGEEADIVEVKYLESTGTQYILLNSQINGFDGWLLPENRSTYGAIGIWNGGARADTIKWTNIQNRGWVFNTGHNNNNVYTYDMTYDFTHVIVDGQSCYVNGNYYQIGAVWGTYFSTYHYFALFGCYHRNGYVSTQSCKIGKCKLYYNHELIYDFVPMRVGVGENAIGYMYEKLSGKYYKNDGSGQFLLGPDIR